MDELIAWLSNSSEWTLAENVAWFGGWLYLSLLVFLAGRDVRVPLVTPAWEFIRRGIEAGLTRLSRRT